MRCINLRTRRAEDKNTASGKQYRTNKTRIIMVCRVMLMLAVASCALQCDAGSTLPPCPPGYTTATTTTTTSSGGSTSTTTSSGGGPSPTTTTEPPTTDTPPTALIAKKENAVFPQTPFPCIPIEPEVSTEAGATCVSHVTGLTLGGALIAAWRLRNC